jgi:hypothetical protein
VTLAAVPKLARSHEDQVRGAEGSPGAQVEEAGEPCRTRRPGAQGRDLSSRRSDASGSQHHRHRQVVR